MAATTDRLIRVTDAADRLGVSPKTIYRMAADGRLKSAPIGSGRKPGIRISEASVTALIASAS
jgi:excisionase family DNA binding protein